MDGWIVTGTSYLIIVERTQPHRVQNYTARDTAILFSMVGKFRNEPNVKSLHVYAELEEWRRQNG